MVKERSVQCINNWLKVREKSDLSDRGQSREFSETRVGNIIRYQNTSIIVRADTQF